jgi:signal transduction histidine kinase
MPANQDGRSQRVAQARARAVSRLRRQREVLRPLGWAAIAVVAATAVTSPPGPGLHGDPLIVTVGLLVYTAATAAAISDRFIDLGRSRQLGVITAMGAAGVTLSALEPRGATDLAAGAAVWMAITRLPLPQGVGLSVAIALGQDAAAAVSGSPPAVILAATLLSGLLGLVAYQLRQARAGQDRTEMLLAQLADARDEQTRAAAIAERGRIATELHDVLAQSLSAAAIQLQGARILAVREGAGSRLSTAIDRASQLVNDGLGNARQAVGALRGEQLPTITQLGPLIDGFRKDMHLDVTLRIEGHAHDLPPDTGLALYRGAQEALTNVARYAPGAAAQVVLCYHRDRTTLSVENSQPAQTAADGGLPNVGGGHGLTGLGERLDRAGGSLHAGPTGEGWRVEMVVPA